MSHGRMPDELDNPRPTVRSGLEEYELNGNNKPAWVLTSPENMLSWDLP